RSHKLTLSNAARAHNVPADILQWRMKQPSLTHSNTPVASFQLPKTTNKVRTIDPKGTKFTEADLTHSEPPAASSQRQKKTFEVRTNRPKAANYTEEDLKRALAEHRDHGISL
ncbi:hypothetical protein PENTCL1PPCAC_3325, partial [Pristionchus entomophagus]